MSIYPVKLSEWYAYGDEMYEIAVSVVNSFRCLACDKKVKYSKAIGHHSIPWGNGDIWCSWKCCKSRKIHKRVDKRRFGRYIRKCRRLGFDNHGIITL
jgi:hypothetical protein